MTDRLHDGLRYLAEQFSASADEFRRDNAPGGVMLLEGLVSRGYAHEKAGRYAVSAAGRRRLEAMERSDGPAE